MYVLILQKNTKIKTNMRRTYFYSINKTEFNLIKKNRKPWAVITSQNVNFLQNHL